MVVEKLRAKPELVADFPTLHKTDVHSVLMNDISSVSGVTLVLEVCTREVIL